MRKLFGKLLQQSLTPLANQVHEIFDFQFSSMASQPSESQREHITLTSPTSMLVIPYSRDSLSLLDNYHCQGIEFEFSVSSLTWL